MDERILLHILDQMSDGVVVLNSDKSIRYASPAVQKMTGVKLNESSPLSDLLMVISGKDPNKAKLINDSIVNSFSTDQIIQSESSSYDRRMRIIVEPMLNSQFNLQNIIIYLQDLTEKMRSDRAQIEYLNNFHNIFENVQSGIVVYGTDGNARIANRKAGDILDLPIERIKNRKIDLNSYRLFGLDGSEIDLPDYPVYRALKDRAPVLDRVLNYRRNEDGRSMWLVASAVPIFREDGEIVEILLSFSDITRLVDSETENRTLRERFELAARATQDAVFDWEIKTGRFWGNEAYKAVYGYDAPAYMSLELLEQTSKVTADHDKVREAVSNAIATGQERYSLDYEFTRPDGTSGHVAVRAFIVRDANGDAQRIIGTATDIGQLTRATTALEQSEKRFRMIADSASDVLWDHDFESGFSWSSPDWPSKLGVDVDPAKFQDFQWIEIVDPSDRDRIANAFKDVIKSDASEWEIEFRIRNSSGEAIDLQQKAAILRHPDGRAYRILGTTRNVTKERRNQEGYSRARALEAVGQLTGGVAHDFNNLLMIILGNVELLEMSDLNEEDAETVAAISEAAESAARLTRQLLTFARQTQLNRTRVDVKELVTATVQLLRTGLPETISFSQSFPPDLWRVDVDANGLQQAIVNLAMNANDAMPRGGEVIVTCSNLEIDEDTIATTADLAPGRYVAISLSDTGAGMPPDILARAFEPFFTTKEVGKGTGLGLSTVYGFARQSNGGVSIYSEQGLGTSVSLYLPAADGETALAAPSDLPANHGETTRQRRILVVEDQPQVRLHVEKTLLRLGYAVATAPDATVALDMLTNGEAFDLLFTDIIMPGGIDGQALGQAALELQPAIKVLYTSGYPAAAFEHLGLKEQSNINFLAKPYKSTQLRDRIAKILTA